jgi:hypothetical protein
MSCRLSRALVTGLLAGISVMGSSGPVFAADAAGAGCYEAGCGIGVQHGPGPGTPPPKAASAAKPHECTYRRDTPIDNGAGGYVIDPPKVDASQFKAGDTVMVQCHDPDTGEYDAAYHTVWGQNGAPVRPPEDVAREALGSVDFGEADVQSWPAPDRVVVGVKTYFNVRNWTGLSRTASADTAPGSPDGVRAHLVARPTRTVWHLGTNGAGRRQDMTCEGAGTQWVEGTDDRDKSLCGFTFPTKGDVTATVEIFYDVAWTSNIGPAGNLPAPAQATTFTIHVRQIQAVGR